MRIILYTGKGGVGKTSVAAATAVRAADMGYKTMIMSTDAAHSLGDAFDMPLQGGEPVPVADRLWGQEIDVLKEMRVHWATVREWLTALMRWQGADEVVAEETAVLPGMEELVGLLYINRYYDQGEYDVMIVDCAPTGETLRLLSFPETMRWYMHRLLPLEKRLAGAIGPLARVFRIPVPQQKVFDTVQDLFQQLERMDFILSQSEGSSVRLVVNPEKMVIKEAQRTFTYLNLYGYATDLVICNRVIPDEVQDPYFRAWKEAQSRYLLMVEEGFSPVPTLQASLLHHEVVGLESLREMAQAIFGERDPTPVFYQGELQAVSREGKLRVMKLPLPFVEQRDVSLMQNGDEVTIQAGQYRRNVILPRMLAGLSVQTATMEGSTLKLTFGEEDGAKSSK